MKKELTVTEFSKELIERIDGAKTIECCKEEIRKLAELAAREIPLLKIEVEWKDK